MAEKGALADLGAGEPVVNPLLELQRLAAEVVNFKDALRSMVERLGSVRYDGPMGEQIRGEVALYERALDRCGRILRDITALRIDERIVEIQSRVSEEQGRLVAGVISASLDELDLTPQQYARAREVVPRHLRALSAGGVDAARRYEDGSRRLTLTDFDRELELLRAERDAMPLPPALRAWPGVDDDEFDDV